MGKYKTLSQPLKLHKKVLNPAFGGMKFLVLRNEFVKGAGRKVRAPEGNVMGNAHLCHEVWWKESAIIYGGLPKFWRESYRDEQPLLRNGV